MKYKKFFILGAGFLVFSLLLCPTALMADIFHDGAGNWEVTGTENNTSPPITATGGSSVIVSDDALLNTDGNDGITVQTGGYTVEVGQNARVAPGGHGVNITGGNSNTVTNEGSIEGGLKPGSYWGYGIGITGGGEGHTIENYGTISSVRGAIDIADSNNVVIANEGNIDTNHLYHPQDNGYFSIGLRGGNGTISNETTGSIIGGNAAAVAIQGLSNTLTNEGSITTTGQFGVLAAGESNTITNSGTIEGGQNLSSLEELQFIPLKAGIGILGDHNEVINENGGTVSSSTSSIHDRSTGILVYGTGNEIRNISGGTITGGEFGVYIADGANTVINSGDILSGKHGIMIQDGASSAVTNDGNVTADNGYGIFIGGGSDNTSITNTGSISGGRGGIDAVGQGITITNETGGSIFVNDGGSHPWTGEDGPLYALGLGGMNHNRHVRLMKDPRLYGVAPQIRESIRFLELGTNDSGGTRCHCDGANTSSILLSNTMIATTCHCRFIAKCISLRRGRCLTTGGAYLSTTAVHPTFLERSSTAAP